jgi:hypothetical protein
MPPTSTDHMASAAPSMNTYQLAMLSLGNARSLVPIIIGMKKFPNTAGTAGIRKKNSIITPCAVNARLYASSVTMAPFGWTKLSRTMPAANPPATKNTEIEIKYRMPIRL